MLVFAATLASVSHMARTLRFPHVRTVTARIGRSPTGYGERGGGEDAAGAERVRVSPGHGALGERAAPTAVTP